MSDSDNILENLVDTKGHILAITRETLAKDFADGDVDAMNGRPMYELGAYCFVCEKSYGLSKLKPLNKQ